MCILFVLEKSTPLGIAFLMTHPNYSIHEQWVRDVLGHRAGRGEGADVRRASAHRVGAERRRHRRGGAQEES